MDKVTGQCPHTTTLLKRKESGSGIEPRYAKPAHALERERKRGERRGDNKGRPY